MLVKIFLGFYRKFSKRFRPKKKTLV
jgi:hypothetical protein